MPRAKNAVAARARRKKVLKQTKGNFGARKNVWTVAKNTYEKGLTYAFRDRRKSSGSFQSCSCKSKRICEVMINEYPEGRLL